MRWQSGFKWDGVAGSVDVECVPNDDPPSYGSWWPDAFGYPVCTARVAYPGRGYRAMLGWVQLVRSSDNDSGGEHFEADPFALFGDAPSPYCWFGIEPTLFDAPSRPEAAPAEWVAHSFLATTPMIEVMGGNPRTRPATSRFRLGLRHTGRSHRVEGHHSPQHARLGRAGSGAPGELSLVDLHRTSDALNATPTADLRARL